MKSHESALPIFSTGSGVPFVFWDNDTWRMTICHGRFETVITYGSPEEDSILVGNSREYLIRDLRGHVVASYNPDSNALSIRRDGVTKRFSVPGHIVGIMNIDKKLGIARPLTS